jgi:hypothetical protein
MNKILSIIFVSLLLSGSANATMKGIFAVELMVEELCHYTNLQPMWATENLKKGNKII